MSGKRTGGMKDNPINYRKTIQSQWGEDGILEEIFNRLGVNQPWCVEFGAWDGRHLSNTWHLWQNCGWSALLIEGNPERCRALADNVRPRPNVRVVEAFVSWQGANRLDAILERAGVPRRFDLLSVDIDGDDYYVFQSLKQFAPRVVVVEYNPTIPPEFDLIQPPGTRFGASALALVNLARGKGYRLVCCTDTNCIFVAADEFPRLEIEEPRLADTFPHGHLTYVLTTFDGAAYLTREPAFAGSFPKPGFRGWWRAFWRRSKPHPQLLGASGTSAIPVKLRKSTYSGPATPSAPVSG
jgi:hypothetical protein